MNKCAIMYEEVKKMDEQRNQTEQMEETSPKEAYTPRPAWQLWAARIGVVIVIVAFLLYVWQIANGGL